MSVHAYKAAGVHPAVRISCIVAGVVGVVVGVFLLVTQGATVGLFALIIGTPILVGLAAAVATIIVTPLIARQVERQLQEEATQERALLGAAALITDAVARYFHPVPALHVPIGPGEVTAYDTGYLAFEAVGGGYYRARYLDGWHEQAPGEFDIECSPLYHLTVHTKHAPEWRAWLTQLHGPERSGVTIDLAAAEQQQPQQQPSNSSDAGMSSDV